MEKDYYVEGPRHAVVTADNVGPIITIITLFLMVVMILAVALRLLLRLMTSPVLGVDDVIVLVASVLALGEVVATSLAVDHGLGTRLLLLSTAERASVQKGLYASGMLYFLTIALAKASTLFLLQRLAISRSHKIVGRVIVVVLVTWTIAGFFGLAFQCNVPNNWALLSDQCFHTVVFWDMIGTLDIVLDVALIILPLLIIWELKLSLHRKVVVSIGFGFRVILCASQILRLVYLHRFAKNTDTLFSSLGFVLATQIQTMFAVVAACIPALKPFMDRIASGLIAISFRDREGTYALDSSSRMPWTGSQGRASIEVDMRFKNIFRSRPMQDSESSSQAGYDGEMACHDLSMSGGLGRFHRSTLTTSETGSWQDDGLRVNESSSWILNRTSEDHDTLPGSSSRIQRTYTVCER